MPNMYSGRARLKVSSENALSIWKTGTVWPFTTDLPIGGVIGRFSGDIFCQQRSFSEIVLAGVVCVVNVGCLKTVIACLVGSKEVKLGNLKT
jgi:hypothetical protein